MTDISNTENNGADGVIPAATSTASKKAFDVTRNSHYTLDPLELCLVGGVGSLPELQLGPLDTERDEAHPLWDPRLLDVLAEDQVANIDAYGVIVPIIIAKIDDRPVVVDGRQRVRAARLVNQRRKARGEPAIKVPAVIRRDSETGLMGAMITLNEVRHDDDPSVKIYKLKRLMLRGVSLEDAAITFGVPSGVAEAWLNFDDNATARVKAAVSQGKLALSAGIELARVKDPTKQAALLDSAIASGATSTRGVRDAKKKIENPDAVVGVDRKTQRALLAHVKATPHKNASEKTLAFWQGVEDALALVLGIDIKDVDKRLVDALATMRAEAAAEAKRDATPASKKGK